MKKSVFLLLTILMVATTMSSCRNQAVEKRPVMGTLEEKMGPDSVPQSVSDVLVKTEGSAIDERFELIMEDKENKVSVWGLMKCSDDESSQGYGVMIAKDKTQTSLAIRHGNQPKAFYDASSGNLWFSGGVMEGTGTNVERPYLIRFDENGKANIVASIDPYDMQQELCKHLSYSIDGQDVTIYVDENALVTITNHTEDMGNFYDDALWIGEQIQYFVDKVLSVYFVPGISFVTGKVLSYDDSVGITAKVNLQPDGSFTLSDFKVVEEG